MLICEYLAILNADSVVDQQKPDQLTCLSNINVKGSPGSRPGALIEPISAVYLIQSRKDLFLTPLECLLRIQPPAETALLAANQDQRVHYAPNGLQL